MSDGLARADAVTRVVLVLLGLGLFVALGRVAQLQFAPDDRLIATARQQSMTTRLEGWRGDILDRRGRVLATTRVAYRAVIDPTQFPLSNATEERATRSAEAMRALAGALGMDPGEVAARVLPAAARNEALQDAGVPTRYVPIGGDLEAWQAERVRALALPGVALETRPIRERATDLAAPVIGKAGIWPGETIGWTQKGLVGAEVTLDDVLAPTPGVLAVAKDAQRRPLWIAPGGYVPPTDGASVRLSVDSRLQQIAEQELRRGVEDANAAGGRLVLVDARTGEIVAMADVLRDVPEAVPFDWANPRAGLDGEGEKPRYITIRRSAGDDSGDPALRRNRCVEDVYEPGSTFKPFMWSAVMERELAAPGEAIDTEGGAWVTEYGRPLYDVERRDEMSAVEVLVYSSNIGMAKLTERLTAHQMHDAIERFGFGRATGVELPGESPGIVTTRKGWTKYSHTSIAMGHEIAVTPVQMARAFCAFARPGELAGTIPKLTLIAPAAGRDERVQVRVLPSDIALLSREAMGGVAERLDARLPRWFPGEFGDLRYRLFAKSGTAEIPLGAPPEGVTRPRGLKGYYPDQYNSGFIAGGPIEDPRLVCIVVIDDPGPEMVRARKHYGSRMAGPVVRRVMERALAYLGVPPSPPETDAAVDAVSPGMIGAD